MVLVLRVAFLVLVWVLVCRLVLVLRVALLVLVWVLQVVIGFGLEGCSIGLGLRLGVGVLV